MCWTAVAFLLLTIGPAAHGSTHISVLPSPLLQSGTASPATPVSSSPSDFSLSLQPAPADLKRGANVTLLAIVAGLGDFSGPVTLSASGDLPQWLVVNFTPSTVTPVAPKPGWTATIGSEVYIDTSSIPNFYSERHSPAGRNTAHAAMAALPFLLLLPAVAMRRTRRRVAPLLAVAALACIPFASGCGAGRYPPQVAPGVYAINIQGTATTGQQHTLPLILRVTVDQ